MQVHKRISWKLIDSQQTIIILVCLCVIFELLESNFVVDMQ